MKLFELRKELKETFSKREIEVEDVDFICAEVLGVSRTELILIEEVTEEQEAEIRAKSSERLNNVPVEKIFNKAYFYGLEFKVDQNVLSPRPETELLVETALNVIKQNQYKTCLDLCTGSGCIAVSIKKNADVSVVATDISQKAITIAKQNAKTNDVEINFIRSNMFEKIEGKFDLIISNPPYIDTDEIATLDAEVINHDPIIALDGGELGLRFYNIIHDNLRKYLNDGGMAMFEIGEDQKEMILALFNDFEFVECIQDYSGLDRIMVFKK